MPPLLPQRHQIPALRIIVPLQEPHSSPETLQRQNRRAPPRSRSQNPQTRQTQAKQGPGHLRLALQETQEPTKEGADKR